MMQTKRTHVVIPEHTVKAIDSLVGKRKRSLFIVRALEEKLQHLKLVKAIDEAAGTWKDEDHPELAAQGGVEKWVRDLRQESERKLKD